MTDFQTREDVWQYLRQAKNWSRWGDDDERGTLNLVTPEKRREAASLVRSGRIVSLSRPFPTHVADNNPSPAQRFATRDRPAQQLAAASATRSCRATQSAATRRATIPAETASGRGSTRPYLDRASTTHLYALMRHERRRERAALPRPMLDPRCLKPLSGVFAGGFPCHLILAEACLSVGCAAGQGVGIRPASGSS